MVGAQFGKHPYQFDWMCFPIILYLEDVVAMSELILGHRPDIIIGTTVARSGLLIFSTSKLAMTRGDVSIANVCSGKPVSFRHLEEDCGAATATTLSNLSRHPYTDFEPKGFEVDVRKFNVLSVH